MSKAVATRTTACAPLAVAIHEHWRLAQAAQASALDHQLAAGRALLQARVILKADRAFGSWFAAQQFPFSRQWAWTLYSAASTEAQIRAEVASQLATGREPNIEAAVKAVRHPRHHESARSRRDRIAPDLFARLVLELEDLRRADQPRLIRWLIDCAVAGPLDERRDTPPAVELRDQAAQLRRGGEYLHSLAAAVDDEVDARWHPRIEDEYPPGAWSLDGDDDATVAA
jgi:hypothetical protein